VVIAKSTEGASRKQLVTKRWTCLRNLLIAVGAGARIRTEDLLITNQLLYR
jgi:hypothetical protein